MVTVKIMATLKLDNLTLYVLSSVNDPTMVATPMERGLIIASPSCSIANKLFTYACVISTMRSCGRLYCLTRALWLTQMLFTSFMIKKFMFARDSLFLEIHTTS